MGMRFTLKVPGSGQHRSELPGGLAGRLAAGVLAVVVMLSFLGTITSKAQSASTDESAHGGVIHGIVKAGTISMPNVKVNAKYAPTGAVYFARTDATGSFSIAVPEDGHYVVHAEFAGYASALQEVTVDSEDRSPQANFFLNLPSQLIQLQPTSVPRPGGGALAATSDTNSGVQLPLVVGDSDFSNDNFVIVGQATSTNPFTQMDLQMFLNYEDDYELRVFLESFTEDSLNVAKLEKAADKNINNIVPLKAETASANKTAVGGPAPPSRYHGTLYWTGGDSELNAKPFAIVRGPSPNPSYHSNGYGLAFGGAPYLPGLTKPGTRDYLFASFFGQLGETAINEYGVVPSEAERRGDFSQLLNTPNGSIYIYNPRNDQPFPGNILNVPLNPVALNLLKYIPEPNLPGAENYHLLTTQGAHTNTLSLRYVRSLGDLSGSESAFGHRYANNGAGLNQSIFVNLNLNHITSDVINLYPGFGGELLNQGYTATVGYTIGKGSITHNLNFTSNRNDNRVTNEFTNRRDIATEVGILGAYVPGEGITPVNSNPFNYGLPNLVLGGFNGLSQTQPNFQLTQTAGLSEASYWSRGRHNIAFGGDFHRVEFNFFGGTNATGSFVFSGFATSDPIKLITPPVPASGSAFADFLLDYPQLSSIEAPEAKAHARQNTWDAFLREDWRVLPNLALLGGVRYDYFSPYSELDNRLATLDYNDDFTAVAPVGPNGTGPVSGARYPRSLVQPERNNFSPHLGFAWEPRKNTVIRGGYGLSFTLAQYTNFVQYLAYQPPYANVQTTQNLPILGVITLKDGFSNIGADIGNYALNRNYRLPYIQTSYLDVQNTLPGKVLLDASYIFSKGTRLDIITAPGSYNSQPFPIAYFDFDNTGAFSKFNALIVRGYKRLQNGLVFQTTYTWAHSIDNASSINAGPAVVAQNWQDILAEEGNSSFDVRQQVVGSFLYQLPFGHGRARMTQGWPAAVFGDWNVAGDFNFATGVPVTPAIAVSPAEVERGTHGSVRPNRVPGTSIMAGGRHLNHWFNTAAFTTEFATGQSFGNASRNSIPGPGWTDLDLSLSKVITLREAKTLELRATATNALNVVQYSGINNQFDSSTVGQVTSAQQMRQFTFLARLRF